MIIVIISLFIFVQASFAESDANMTSVDDDSASESQLLTSQNDHSNTLKESSLKNKTIFIISDSPGTNVMDAATDELYNQDNLSGFNVVLRSGDQVKEMDEEELHTLFDKSDAFIGE